MGWVKCRPREVVTWASASSLRALTRESSFSFSKAHWGTRRDNEGRRNGCAMLTDAALFHAQTCAVWLVLAILR